jgi:hypothetical protein
MVEGRENTQEKVAESEERVSGKEASEGKWSEEELAKFMVFLYFNKEIMCSKQQRRYGLIYQGLSGSLSKWQDSWSPAAPSNAAASIKNS